MLGGGRVLSSQHLPYTSHTFTKPPKPDPGGARKECKTRLLLLLMPIPSYWRGKQNLWFPDKMQFQTSPLTLVRRKGIRFERGSGFKKYTAVFPDGERVHFGDTRYQQYRDQVPRSLGGGLYSKLDHHNQVRRANYRKRHGALTKSKYIHGVRVIQRYVDIAFSPAWFSYHFLW